MTLTTICFLTRMPQTYSCQMVEALFTLLNCQLSSPLDSFESTVAAWFYIDCSQYFIEKNYMGRSRRRVGPD